MRSSARSAALALITVFCFAQTLPAQAPAPAKQPAAKTSRGSVSGRITIKDKPAPGVLVGLRRFDGLNPFETLPKAFTDQDGVYHITSVAAGSYHVIPSTPAYVSTASDYNVQPVVVNEDENVEGVNFSLVRGGVITGKVTDADGRPVIQIQVDIFRADLIDRQAPVRQMYPVNSSMTDDRGIYRVYGLLPGKYKVGAGRSDEFTGGFSIAQRSTYKQVFHPDVSDSAKATVVEVGEGGEAKDVDISLARAMQTFSVSGHVINSDTGLPVPNVRYGLSRIIGERSDYVNTGIAANDRGDFITEGLLPGKYAIVQYPDPANELRLETMTFEVVDQDITDLAIKLAKGGSISGVVVLESDDKAARSKLPELQLRGFVSVAAGSSSSVSSMIAADGGFHFGGLQNGALNISLTEKNMPFPPKGFAISRIERDGVTIPQLQIKDAESITGVKIVVSYGTASLRGVIGVENGAAPPNARYSVRLTRSGENNSNIRPPQVDSRGHFLIEGLPAGSYDVTATMIGPGKRYQATRSVTVADGAITDIALTIDLTPSPQ
jgi:5-hydroxyisourate hydrolase-like protein (transthyretin family)